MSGSTIMNFVAPPFDEKEALRYAGCRDGWDNALPRACFDELAPQLSYRVCFAEYQISRDENGLDLGFAKTDSKDLARALRGCDQLIAFAATVGFAPDRLVSRYERLSPAKALLFQAIGAERIEALCDVFSDRIAAICAEKGYRTTTRFSPGYGDLDLSIQQPLLTALDAAKRCGITLTEGFLMLPTKSVTALIGLKTSEGEASQRETEHTSRSKHKCASCPRTDCAFRR